MKAFQDHIFYGVLSWRSTRYGDWMEVFMDDKVPLKSPVAVFADVPGMKSIPVYLLDIDELEEEQLTRLCDFLSQRFETPRDQIEEVVRQEGLPILASEVTVLGQGLLFI